MEKKSLFERKNFLRQKLMSATALLLVASIMMVSSSYAWFVMSTAPEVSNIRTQVGSNGALEVALLDSSSWDNLDLLDMGDFDESVEAADVLDNNLTWGNIVNLSSSSYGLNQIVLNPARLNISNSGTDDAGDVYQIGNVLLKTPIYGEDGRIRGLDSESALSYIFSGGGFSTEGHGVRAIGTASGMSTKQLGLNSARNQITTYMAAARRDASGALNSSGGDLANIVVRYAVSNQTTGFTVSDIESARKLALGLQTSLSQLETALRYVFAGFAATDGAIPAPEEPDGLSADERYQAVVERILGGENTLGELQTEFSGITELVPNIGTYISVLTNDQNKVQQAINACDAKISENRTYSWEEISDIVYPLMDTDRMTVGGKDIETLKNEMKNPDGSVNFEAALDLVMGGIVIAVPSGSGILSDIADYAGDYSSAVTVKNFSYNDIGPMDISATMKTATTANPVYLNSCSAGLKSAGSMISGDSGGSQITDFFGYAIDLAFRTNAEESDLLLQTDGVQRIYDDGSNPATLGGGSYMRFSTNSGLSVTKMIKMMKAIRVVFMDDAQKVLAIAALDCSLGKDAYVELSDSEKTETGMYAYLNAYPSGEDNEEPEESASSGYQISDLISYDDYSRLPDVSTMDIDIGETTYVTARLYTRFFSMTESAATHFLEDGSEDTENTYYTGGLSVYGNNDQVITSLRQDVVKRITALVYLDGSIVTNAMVAADSTTSMTGVLNLQFSSSATLIPAENAALRSGSSNGDEEQITVTKEQLSAAITAIKADEIYTAAAAAGEPNAAQSALLIAVINAETVVGEESPEQSALNNAATTLGTAYAAAGGINPFSS